MPGRNPHCINIIPTVQLLYCIAVAVLVPVLVLNRAIGSNPPISGYCTGTGNERLFFGRFSSDGLRGGGGFCFCFSQNGLVLVLILARRTCTALLNFSTVKKCEV